MGGMVAREKKKKTDTHYNYQNQTKRKKKSSVQGQKFEKTLQQHLIFPI